MSHSSRKFASVDNIPEDLRSGSRPEEGEEEREDQPVRASGLGLRRADPMEEMERRRDRAQELRMKNRARARR